MQSLCFLLLGLLFDQIETFIQISDKHIAVEVGKDVTLNCTFDGTGDSNPGLIWDKEGVDQIVHKYEGNKNDFSDQHKNYTKRTVLHGVNKGDASLTLKNVNIWDEGVYNCRVYSDHGFGEGSINLSVWAQSPNGIQIVWKSNGNGNDVLSCQSSGWYPEPDATWKDNHGNHLNDISKTIVTRDNDGSFRVEHDLMQEHDSKNQYICSKKHLWMKVPVSARAVFTDGGNMVRIDDGSPSSDL